MATQNHLSLTTKIAIMLSKKLLNKYRSHYTKLYNKDLDIILVGGTAGKSTMTLLSKSLFDRAGFQVFSGAKNSSCLNSITGVTMMLAGFEYNFEGAGGIWKKILFLIRGALALIFGQPKLQQKSIIIYEVGVDSQFEMEQFLEIFSGVVNTVLLANLTDEHNLGFDSEFDSESYEKYKVSIPDYWQKILEKSEIEGVLRNVALEQFKLLSLTKDYVIPLNLGSIDNGIMSTIFGSKETQVYIKSERNDNFDLEVDVSSVGGRYLLPLTFGKNIAMIDIMATKFGIPKTIVENMLQDIRLPNGRYGKFKGVKGTTIIDSSYNADPASLASFLQTFEEVAESFITKSRGGNLPPSYVIAPKHTFVLGEMRELGDSSRVGHKLILDQMVSLISQYGHYIQDVYLLGQSWMQLDDQIKKTDGEVSFVRHSEQLFKVYTRAGDINSILTQEEISANQWFWIKGSQNTIFAEIVVEHLLADKSDKQYLCRQGKVWDRLKLPYR